jgi:hypothetical protein
MRARQKPLKTIKIEELGIDLTPSVTIENIKKRRGVILSFGGLYTPFDPLLFFFLPNYNKKFVEIFAKAFWIVFKKQ